MTGTLLIKVCGMRDPANRMELEDLPIDLFGTIFYTPSPRYAGHLPREVLTRLTATAKEKVAVFVDAGFHEIRAITRSYGFTFVQLHGSEPPALGKALKEVGLKVIKAVSADPVTGFSLAEEFTEAADYFLFDTRTPGKGGSGEKWDWRLLETYRGQLPFFLSGGIAPGDAAAIAALRHPALCGIDLNSGFEHEPGIKNRQALHAFIETLKM